MNFGRDIMIGDMYSLSCIYYNKEFPTLEGLIKGVMEDGMDPNYEVVKNGEGIGESLCDFIVH